MLGKDYMLAIIIVNCDDNLWNDQTLEMDPDLPPGWRTIRDTSGTYYWHVPTGTTQWQHPACSSDVGLGSDKLPPVVLPALGNEAAVPGSPAVRRAARGGKFETNMPASSSLDLRKANDLFMQARERLRMLESGAKNKLLEELSRDEVPWQDSSFERQKNPESKCFAVRSLGWVEIPEEDLTPGKSSIAVNNCIQQLSYSKSEGRQAGSAWGEGQDMVLVLRKDTLSLVDPVDHSLIHSQPIINIRVWGVGCNRGRDFAYVASDKDTCMLKCHVFHCDTPAKAIASALHQMCSQIIAKRVMTNDCAKVPGAEEELGQVDFPLQVDLLEAVRQSTQTFRVQYIGCLPVASSRGMKPVNEAIGSLLDSSDWEAWPSVLLRVTDTTLSVCKGEESEDLWWECLVRYLTFLGVGKDPHTIGFIVDSGRQCFKCHVFWCEPDAGCVSEAIQAACMLQYQKCLVASTPLAGSGRAFGVEPPATGLKKHAASLPLGVMEPEAEPLLSTPKLSGASNLKRGVLALIDTFRQKPSALQMP